MGTYDFNPPDEDELDLMLGPAPIDEEEGPEPEFDVGGFDAFLEGASDALMATQPPRAPRSFLEGLVYGGARGLGSRGQRVAEARAKFEAKQAELRKRKDQLRLKEKEDYLRRRADLVGDLRKEDVKRSDEQKKFERDNPKLSPEQLKAAPWLARVADPEGRVSRDVLFSAFKPKEPKDKDKEGALDRADWAAVNTAIRTDPFISKYRDIQFGHQLVRTGAGLNSPQGDLSLIFGYMKMLDPGSVVREGEYANAENTKGVPEHVRAQYNRMLRGDKLTQDQRIKFKEAAEALLKDTAGPANKAYDRYRRTAKILGIPEEVLFDEQDLSGEGAPRPGAAQSRVPFQAPPTFKPKPGGFFDSNRPGAQ